MRHITSPEEALELFKALGSDVRIDIIKLLLKQKYMSMNELARELQLTNGALTGHIKKLENCGIISFSGENARHGNQKLCTLTLDKILIDIETEITEHNYYNTELKVGQYSDYSIYPTCGLANAEKLIGDVDDKRYFAHPDHYTADILWFTKGYVSYDIPNLTPSTHRITQIMISAELSSEAPGTNNLWPSDITFSLNDIELGSWTSPGDFGDVHGTFTPEWWPTDWNQYGLLKLLVINEKGSFIDGHKISDVDIAQITKLHCTKFTLRMEVKENAEHVGGLTIYGRSFGNYSQDIKVSIHSVPPSSDLPTP